MTLVRTIGLAASAAAILAVAPSPAQAQAKLDDPTIVAIFDAANMWDVETSRLGEKKGTTKEIRDLAAMFIRDHSTVRQQARDLAKKLGVTPTPPKDFAMAKDHAATMKKLEGLSGKAFDKAYLENEVAFHKAVISAMTTTLLPALKNAEVKELVTMVVPAFKAHQDAAQNVLDKQK
jgi:putative membrane protein